MAKFFSSYNKNIIAVISEEHLNLIVSLKKESGSDCQELYQTALEKGVRIFTFCPNEWFELYPSRRHVFTGTYENLELLISHGNHTIVPSIKAVGWMIYVPFSNSYENGDRGKDNDNKEMKYHTSIYDVRAAFFS